MHVAGRADGDIQPFAQPQYGAVEFPELVFILCGSVPQHELIIAYRLDFEKIIKFCDIAELAPRFAVHYGLKKLALLACAAEYQALAVLEQFCFCYTGSAVEIVKMRPRNQLI